MTTTHAVAHDLGYTITVQITGEVRRFVHFSPDEAVAVFDALSEWVLGLTAEGGAND